VAQRVGRGIALLFHDRGTRRGWVVSSTPRPHFTPEKDPVPIIQEAGWAPGPVWTGGKSRPYRDSIPDHPARSQSPYRLSYPAHMLLSNIYIYVYVCIYIYTNIIFISLLVQNKAQICGRRLQLRLWYGNRFSPIWWAEHNTFCGFFVWRGDGNVTTFPHNPLFLQTRQDWMGQIHVTPSDLQVTKLVLQV